jgi:hypothetical protein
VWVCALLSDGASVYTRVLKRIILFDCEPSITDAFTRQLKALQAARIDGARAASRVASTGLVAAQAAAKHAATSIATAALASHAGVLNILYVHSYFCVGCISVPAH